jgi:DUF4097 and DUF4098 domain-containing protein YvlB
MKPSARISIPLVAFFCAFALAQSSIDQPQPEHFTRNFSVSPGSTLRVENYKGTIHVTGGSGNQVAVTVDKKFEGRDSDRKWWMENVRVKFENDANQVRVAVEYPTINCMFGCGDHDYTASVELTIEVPQKTNLNIDGYKPDIKLASVDGDIRVKSYKSPIDIESTTGAIDISTYKETVRLHDVSVRGDFHLKMEKGDATIEAKTLGSDADIETEKGSVVLRVPRSTGINVDYSGSRRSSLHSDLPIASETGFRSSELRGTINGGGTHLRLRTDKGSFSIEGLI